MLRHQDLSQRVVVEFLAVSVACVNRWSQRFEPQGIVGLRDQPGLGQPPAVPACMIEQVISQGGQQSADRTR